MAAATWCVPAWSSRLKATWKPNAIIIIEFPDLERARTWYRSAEYASALAIRDDAISRDMILVEGMP